MKKLNNMKTILAIDPGIANLGWAFQNRYKQVRSGTVVTPPSETVQQRLYFLSESLPEEVDQLVIEDFVGSLGRKTVWLIGAILSRYPSSEVRLIHPRRWVADTWGKGLDKEKYKEAARIAYPDAETQHEADALCLLRWYQIHGGNTCPQDSKKPKKTSPKSKKR